MFVFLSFVSGMAPPKRGFHARSVLVSDTLQVSCTSHDDCGVLVVAEVNHLAGLASLAAHSFCTLCCFSF
jgi:hypothetical protein